MTEQPIPPGLYFPQRNQHLQYLLDLWHAIGQDHAEFTRKLMLGSFDPQKYAELLSKVLEMWKEIKPFDNSLPDWEDFFIDPTKALEEKVTWINKAILELSFSLKRLGITEFREVEG